MSASFKTFVKYKRTLPLQVLRICSVCAPAPHSNITITALCDGTINLFLRYTLRKKRVIKTPDEDAPAANEDVEQEYHRARGARDDILTVNGEFIELEL